LGLEWLPPQAAGEKAEEAALAQLADLAKEAN
jgi:hypothetical protein